MSETREVIAKNHESYGTLTLVAFFIPIVGIIFGIVYLAKDKLIDKKLGEHLIAISILFIIIQGFLLNLFWGRLFTATPILTQTPITSISTPAPSNWDPADYYDKVQNGHTKGQVEQITGKISDNCTTTEALSIGTMEYCSYGSAITDKGMLSVTYLNGKVYSKTKTSL